MTLPSYLSSLANGEPHAVTKLEDVQADGTPLLVSANEFRGNITQANQTSQTNIASLVLLLVQNDEVLRDMMARTITNAHTIPSNGDISGPSLSHTKSFKNIPSSPSLVPEDRETLQRAREERLTEMVEKRGAISAGFTGLLNKCSAANVDAECMLDVFEAIEEDIDEKKLGFELISESLIKTVQSSPLEETKLSVLFHLEVFDKMERISQALEVAPGFLETIFNNLRDKDNPELDEHARRRAMQPKSEAKDVLADLSRCLDQFDELAQRLIGEHPNTQKDPSHMFSLEEFKRLSGESIATATLFQCFCKACPRHQRHTAYLSLESSTSAAPGTRMAILSSGPKEKDPVWLRVVSEPPQRPSRKAGDDMEWTPETGKHKRRRSSDGLAPPSKSRKTVTVSPGALEHDSHVGIDTLLRNPIQVCPEYLAQHEEAEYPVMQMVDASSAFHKFYFLPADERPPANCEPVSLHKMLLQHHRRIVTIGNTQILWKVQVARLIAEAALQFDWPETRCHWGREDIIFYTRQPSSDILGPFLKVEIERRPHTNNTTSGKQPQSGGGQMRRLLNLAFTLLQVGLFKPIEPPPEDWKDSMYRDYIVKKISTDEAQITGDYITVVRQCTKLAAAAGGANIDREDFRKRYYQYIISPLRRMETSLLGLQREIGDLDNLVRAVSRL